MSNKRKWVLLGPGPELGGEVARVAEEVGAQRFDVARAIRRLPHRVHQHSEPLEPELREEPVRERDHLDVDVGVMRSEDLGAQLPVLAVPALLRALVAEVRREVPGLPRRRRAVLHVRAHDGCCPFRSQREMAITAVGELVHLLAHDVGAGADALEHLDVLEDRRDDEAVPKASRPVREHADDLDPRIGLGCQHIVCADGSAVHRSVGLAHWRIVGRVPHRSAPIQVWAAAPAPGRARYASKTESTRCTALRIESR